MSTTSKSSKASPPNTEITILVPDDFHHHFRDGIKTKHVVHHTNQRFKRCIAMPNLSPPVTTAPMATDYRQRILSHLPTQTPDSNSNSQWEMEPLMTLYLTDATSPQDIQEASKYDYIKACKLYPANATTNSAHGVTNVKLIYPALREMAKCGLLLLLHSEVTGDDIDIFDREAQFITDIMTPLAVDHPNLKMVMEHISTQQAVEYICHDAPPNVAASITAHHMLYNRNAILVGGIKPHFYCLPILKRETHRRALVTAATSGNPRFFAGTDSAPHTVMMKESVCGCAGVYTAHAAVELYAEVFDTEGALDKLEGFLSHHGADFYGLERNTELLTLTKESWEVPYSYPFGWEGDRDETVKGLRHGEYVHWKIVGI